MKPTILFLLAGLLFTATAFADPVPTTQKITVQQAVELYSAIRALDNGYVKMVDGKPTACPFTIAASLRFVLADDSAIVKPTFDAEQATLTAEQGAAGFDQSHPD